MAKKSKIKAGITAEMQAIIDAAVKAGMQAGQSQAERSTNDPYKATEKKLYALPILRKKLGDDRDALARLGTEDSPERSKSIVRYSRTGYRAGPEEILEARIRDLEATIAADEYEIEIIESALATIADDPYYFVIEGKYIQGLTNDDEIAAKIPCEKTTVYRNRKRLITRLAIMFYGSFAVK